MELLRKLNIYGWDRRDENAAFISILTGDPFLMLARHGTAKTAVAIKMAKTLKVPYAAYDASKAQFEDVIGFPDPDKYMKGIIEYIASPQTIWDKEFLFIDEVGRAKPQMQNKWLEVIRSRRVMGFPTNVKWVWSAMNPITSIGGQQLDEAFIGRYSLFVFPPEVMSMEAEDRDRILQNIDYDDAPAVQHWLNKKETKKWEDKIINGGLEEAQELLANLMKTGVKIFTQQIDDLAPITDFVGRFAELLSNETSGAIKLDGRRLGFIYRNILAGIAIERARDAEWGEESSSLGNIIEYTVKRSLPIGLNAEDNADEILHTSDNIISMLSDVFQVGTDLDKINKVYELFTTSRPARRLSILLNDGKLLPDMIKSRAWNKLMETDFVGPLAMFAIKYDIEHPGAIPPELLKLVSEKIDDDLPIDTWFTLKMGELNLEAKAKEISQMAKTDFELVAAFHVIKSHTSITDNGLDELKKS